MSREYTFRGIGNFNVKASSESPASEREVLKVLRKYGAAPRRQVRAAALMQGVISQEQFEEMIQDLTRRGLVKVQRGGDVLAVTERAREKD